MKSYFERKAGDIGKTNLERFDAAYDKAAEAGATQFRFYILSGEQKMEGEIVSAVAREISNAGYNCQLEYKNPPSPHRANSQELGPEVAILVRVQ